MPSSPPSSICHFLKMPQNLNRLELEANIFRIFISLWYLLIKISKKGWHVLDDLTWNYPEFFPFSNRCYDHCKNISIAAVVWETYSFIKIMQNRPNYNCQNRVKQIKITEKYVTKTLVSGSKCIKHFFKFLPLFALYLLIECDLFNMPCLS